jgi:hypothetical protein
VFGGLFRAGTIPGRVLGGLFRAGTCTDQPYTHVHVAQCARARASCAPRFSSTDAASQYWCCPPALSVCT